MTRAIALVAVVVGACSGAQGTLAVDLGTAPGSHVMDAVATLHVTVTNPTEEHDVDRADDGSFALDLDLTAGETSRAITVDGVDAGGTVIAAGASPLLPVNAISAHVVIFMAAPLSVTVSPSALSVARSDSGIAALTYGAVVVGGSGPDGHASDVVDIYNVFDHSVVQALPMPEARTSPIVAAASGNLVLIFGGASSAGTMLGTYDQLETTVAPSGAYVELGDHADVARSGETVVQTAAAGFTVSGTPALEITAGGDVGARTDVAGLPRSGAGTKLADGTFAALFAGLGAGPGNGGLVRFAGDVATTDATADGGVESPGVCALPGADAFLIAGGTAAGTAIGDLVRVDAKTGARAVVGHLATPRVRAAIAATDRFIVVAGGIDGNVQLIDTVEVFDATTFQAVAAPQVLAVPRYAATAIALANGQIAIIGGLDHASQATSTIELFTPPN